MQPIRRALISVSDKTGVMDIARALADHGVEIVSTGGTKARLSQAGIPVIGVSEVTGFPEILDGRVKTLHPRIHAGILAMRGKKSHQRQLEERKISLFDLVICNLYPFRETVAKPEVSFAEAVENIDIGGPSMIRAAAKNHPFVTVVVDPADYPEIIPKVQKGVEEEMRRRFAAKAFRHTASYDAMIAEYLTQEVGEVFPETLTVTYDKVQSLRYGENPQQQASFYRELSVKGSSIATATQLHGKALSFNNINDGNAALEMVGEFLAPAVVAVKHMNPCGIGVGSSIEEAWDKAYEADPVSIFGGIVALNRPVDEKMGIKMKEIFLEMIIAPSFTEAALSLLQEKKNLRLLVLSQENGEQGGKLKLQTVKGGLLVQEEDTAFITQEDCQVVTKRQPTEAEWKDLLFAWKVVKHVKSNAIVLAKDGRTLGIGAGQMNRVGSCKIALKQAGKSAPLSALASDAFFPMADTVEVAGKQGVSAIIQPGGSIRDEESIAEADRQGIAMVFTQVRHFKH